MASPSPVPRCMSASRLVPRKNFSNRRFWSCSEIPMPLSCTAKITTEGRVCRWMVTAPPSGVYLIAFSTRLYSAWWRSAWSASMACGRSRGSSTPSEMLFSFACACRLPVTRSRISSTGMDSTCKPTPNSMRPRSSRLLTSFAMLSTPCTIIFA